MNSARSADTLPRVKAVGATRQPWTLSVIWKDGTKDRVDLTGLVYRSRHFRAFLDKPAAFRRLRVAPFGSGIEWENGLDYGADTLKMMADEQKPLRGADLVEFETGLDLSTAETAALFGLAERTVRAYRRAKRLPETLALAIRVIRANDTLLAAHYRPIGQRRRGRPRKDTAAKAA